MTERTMALREHVIAERGAGARVRTLPAMAEQSLRRTASEPLEIRRAKAQAHILDTAHTALLPHELLIGSSIGNCPLDPAAPDYAQLKKAGEHIADALAATGARILPPLRTGLTANAFSAKHIAFEDHQRLTRELSLAHRGPNLAPGALPSALMRAGGGSMTAGERALSELPWTPACRFAPDFEALLNIGFRGLDAACRQGLKAATSAEQAQFFEARRIALGAAQRFMLRCANAASAEANRTPGVRGAELSGMAQTLRKLAAERADTFYEGMQLILSVLTMLSLCGSESVAVGRLDALLGSRYDADILSGDLAEADAIELIACLFIKLNEPGTPGTCAVTLGGAGGENALTKLCLDVAKELALPHPSLGVRLSETSPDWLVEAASALAKTGLGQMKCLSDEVLIERLIRRGVPYQAAHDYCLIGDGLVGVPGTSAGLIDAGPLVLPDLIQRVHAKCRAGELALASFDQFLEGYKAEISRAAAEIWLSAHEASRAMEASSRDPLASLFIAGCAESGLDALRGGAALGRTFLVPLVGLANAADALCAVKKWVYDKGSVRLDTLAQAAEEGFSQRGMLLRLLRESPRYGNDLAEVDDIARAVLQVASEAVSQLSLAGGADRFVPALADGALHAALGERMPATWDGRLRGEPLSGGADPHPGRDAGGLSALIRSASKLDSDRLTGGFALNLTLSAVSLAQDGWIKKCLDARLPAFRLCAQDTEALLDARDSRERAHTGCTGGLCEWFCELDAALQDEIIKRTVN